MTDSELAQCWARRKARAECFLKEPSKYKICDQCRAVCLERVGVCPICHAYRFNQSRAAVIETAREFAKHAFPVTLGIVPRV